MKKGKIYIFGKVKIMKKYLWNGKWTIFWNDKKVELRILPPLLKRLQK